MQANQKVILGIMLAVLAWGMFHALGAWLNYDEGRQLLRPLVVLGCVLTFLGFWGTLLAMRARRIAKHDRTGRD